MNFHPGPESRPRTVREAFRDVPEDGTGDRVGPHTKIWRAMKDVPPGGKQPGHFSHQRLEPGRPSPTIQKGGGLGHYHLWHPDHHRVITLAECKRLASFPDGYAFPGKPGEVWDRIGNGVPPLFMRAIATRVRELIGKPAPPRPPSSEAYRDILESAWRDHLKPKAPDAPTVISTFAGGGGSSLGYSMAGFRELLAVEMDDNAVATLRLNFPDVPVFHGDIAKLSVEDCLSRAGIAPGELDVLDGSPPCQGFSTAGKRQMDDPRNQLFREYVRLLRGLQPRAFVMENVSGMVKGKMKLVFAEILRELKASGYAVKARLLNAMYFNVPQSRERMIFVGIREDMGIEPSHPKAESVPIPAGCIRSIPSPAMRHSVRLAAMWDKLRPGQSGDELPENHGNGFSTTKVDPSRPCPTLTKGWTAGTGLLHWRERRLLSVPELAQIGSFSLSYQFAGNPEDAVRRIGNSVPPLLMRSVASHVRELIIPRPSSIEALGY